MPSTVTFISSCCIRISPSFPVITQSISRARVRFRTLASGNSISLSSGSIAVSNGGSYVRDKEGNKYVIYEETEEVGSRDDSTEKVESSEGSEGLEVLWDDGYGTRSVKDYLDMAKEMVKPDGGPPRWFCPIECGNPINDSHVLLFLPGMDGVGLGLILHHKALGK